MNHPNDPTPPELAATRIDLAQQDLDDAEAMDLATASNAELVAIVEKLRGGLSDMIRLARQVDPRDH